jgi:hypothetical protein
MTTISTTNDDFNIKEAMSRLVSAIKQDLLALVDALQSQIQKFSIHNSI